MIVVTGGPGFLGSRVLPLLAGQDDLLVVPVPQMWRPPVRELLDDGRARLGTRPDWWTPAGAAQLASEVAGKAVTLLHLGYLPPDGGSAEDRLAGERAVNRDGTLGLVAALQPARVVHASTAQVYGAAAARGEPVAENVAPEPLSPYGIAKAETEQELARWAGEHGAAFTALRLATLFGTMELVGRAVPNFIRAALRGVPATINGPGLELSDYLDVDSAAAAVAAAVRDPQGHGAVNIASGVGRTTLDVHRLATDHVATMTGREPIPARHQDASQRPHLVLDPALGRDCWGLEAPRRFGAVLAEEAAWLRAHEERSV